MNAELTAKMDALYTLVAEARNSEDEILCNLRKDLIDKAIKYMTYRVNWSVWSNEERAENDSYRTSAHNAMMDAVNIFLRYERKLEKTDLNLEDLVRGDYGDLVCEMLAKIANANR